MSKLFFFGESFPAVFLLQALVLPLFADDLGDIWIGKTGMTSNNVTLIMLAIEDESYYSSVGCLEMRVKAPNSPLRGRGIFGSGWQIHTCAVESPLLTRV